MKWYFAAAVLAACIDSSQAQTGPALRIVVEGVGKEAAACGIKTEAVESTAVGCTTRLGVSVRGNPDAEPQIRAFRSKAGAYVGFAMPASC